MTTLVAMQAARPYGVTVMCNSPGAFQVTVPRSFRRLGAAAAAWAFLAGQACRTGVTGAKDTFMLLRRGVAYDIGPNVRRIRTFLAVTKISNTCRAGARQRRSRQ